MELPKVCQNCHYFKSGRCYRLYEEIDIGTDTITGYIEDGILSENINESIDYDLKDLAEWLADIVPKTKINKVVQIVEDYLLDNQYNFVEKIDVGVSNGIMNNCSEVVGDFIIKSPWEFSCKYYWQ